jgi:multicomponent K+:H+ antiporter subunit E
MRRKLLPHPYLTLTLIVLWMLLVNEFKIGSLVMATGLGVTLPLLTAAWWPGRPQMAHPVRLFIYAIMVLWDVIVANFQVAYIILFMPPDRIRSAWITIPLDLRAPEAITLLAGTITMTPGTLTADMSSCGRALLVHCLHAPDPDATRDDIKSRYEARLKRIFE